ncbi:MAG: ATP-binding protein [Candidatus Diapherotrites archaeon]
MIRRELINIIAGYNFWGKEQETGISRETLKKASKFVRKGTALSIVGIRKCGKTYLTKQILAEKISEGKKKEQTVYINFEDPSFEPYLSTSLLDDTYETYRYYLNKDKTAFIVLDEIQNIEKWEKWVRTMLEKKEDIQLIITGSSSKLLSSEIASLLTGRTITVSLYPLSFKEFIIFKGFKEFLTEQKALVFLEEFIEFGGFPMVVLAENQEFKTIYLKEIFGGILTRDIVKRYEIRQEHELRSLAVLLINNFSSFVSVNKLRNIMYNVTKIKLSPTTINNYLKYFSDPFLFFFIPIFSYKIKDPLQYPKKVYCIDTGIINKVSQKFSQDKGKLYENIVGVELVKRFGKENIFYWKSKQQEEIDFLVKQQKPETLIQVCYDLKPENKKRELKPLLKASKELKCNKLLVITRNYKKTEMYKRKKINFVPLWEWLLQD